MELNHRPHAYQACALTELSYRPIGDRAYFILNRFLKDQQLDLSKLNSDTPVQTSSFLYLSNGKIIHSLERR